MPYLYHKISSKDDLIPSNTYYGTILQFLNISIICHFKEPIVYKNENDANWTNSIKETINYEYFNNNQYLQVRLSK